MATTPDSPQPNRINPQSPPETPTIPTPGEQPGHQPDEIQPNQPDTYTPDSAPSEVPDI